MAGIITYVLLFTASIALGQGEPEFIQQGGFLDVFKSWPEIGKLIAFVVALQVFLRGLSEALTRIADYTENTWDNKAAAWISEVVWFLGVLLGKIGYGTPKLVAKEETKQVLEPKPEEKK